MKGKIKKIYDAAYFNRKLVYDKAGEYVKKLEERNKILNAFVHYDLVALTNSICDVGRELLYDCVNELSGVPYCVKDNICTRRFKATCGSKILENYMPEYCSDVYTALRQKGALCVGSTNMDEFAMGSSCENSIYGASNNPHDEKRITGGSSGGAAAAVAAEMTVFALGSDTGGSVRQPAAHCGCIGLKPTYGSVSRHGLIAYASSFDEIGILARSAEDTAIVFDIISKYKENDLTTTMQRQHRTVRALEKSVRGLRIGVDSDIFLGASPEVSRAIERAINEYKSLGAEVVPVKMPGGKECLAVYYTLVCAEAASNLSRYDGVRYGRRAKQYSDIEDMMKKSRTEGFGTEVKRRIMLGNFVLSSEHYDKYYVKAQNMRKAICAQTDELFEDVDLLLTPTAPTTAPLHGAFDNDILSAYSSDIYTVLPNICGIPAISIPCGFDSNRMPIGMQLMAGKFCERTLIRAASAFENQLGEDEMYGNPKHGGGIIEL